MDPVARREHCTTHGHVFENSMKMPWHLKSLVSLALESVLV